MNKKKILLTTLACVAGCYAAFAQERLTIDNLIEQLLAKNYDIKISEQRTKQAQNNHNSSPFLPTLSANARQSQNTVGVTTNTLGVGASVNWRMFDGLAMFAQYDKSRMQLDVATLNELATVEDMVREVINQYYLIVSLNSRVKVANELVEVSQKRYNNDVFRYHLDAISRLEMGLAKSDFNTDSIYLIRQIESLDLAYIKLNNMLNFDHAKRNYISDTIIMEQLLDKQQVADMVEQRNTNILMAKKGLEISDINVRLAKAAAYPTLDFSAGYNYNAVNERPSESFKSSNGANWGFTIGVKIFDAMNIQRNINNSRLDRNISSISQENTLNSVMASFNSMYVNYINNMQLIDFETDNTETMRFNFEIAYDRYTNLRDMSGIDFRIIQQQYFDVVDRKINAMYLAKISEVSLKYLAGQIVSKY